MYLFLWQVTIGPYLKFTIHLSIDWFIVWLDERNRKLAGYSTFWYAINNYNNNDTALKSWSSLWWKQFPISVFQNQYNDITTACHHSHFYCLHCRYIRITASIQHVLVCFQMWFFKDATLFAEWKIWARLDIIYTPAGEKQPPVFV